MRKTFTLRKRKKSREEKRKTSEKAFKYRLDIFLVLVFLGGFHM
jgi:hypothetical protein